MHEKVESLASIVQGSNHVVAPTNEEEGGCIQDLEVLSPLTVSAPIGLASIEDLDHSLAVLDHLGVFEEELDQWRETNGAYTIGTASVEGSETEEITLDSVGTVREEGGQKTIVVLVGIWSVRKEEETYRRKNRPEP